MLAELPSVLEFGSSVAVDSSPSTGGISSGASGVLSTIALTVLSAKVKVDLRLDRVTVLE
ncbi:Uncharacterised protein [Chlamydia trachomatis]|nr:Uncharacterised protein [Chlamydia trachomatis]CRH48855.1 Uncharacterised protein [Chlamydia trachomatis]